MEPALSLRNITKRFGSKVANNEISLDVMPGSVHALVGENGAGKSTLMSMIAGTAEPDGGTITFEGKQVRISSPRDADALGIGMVHQHFKLVPSLTVAANIFLGREEAGRTGTLNTAAMEHQVKELSEQFGLAINPSDRVQDLSVGEQQRVEILKALSHDTKLLILDEPTAVLTPSEADDLFIVIRGLVAAGCSVVFISHKLGEVLSIADTITVIRDGRVIGSQPAAGLTEPEIASMMVGREVLLRVKHTPASPGDVVLQTDGVYAVDSRGSIAVRDLSLTVHAGEIVGIAGVEGNGQSELAEAICGMQPALRGSVQMLGEDVTTASVARRRAQGLGYVPEDRHAEGTAPQLNVAENLVATSLRPPFSRAGWLRGGAVRMFAEQMISKFDVRGAHPDTVISTLSGGNMQKVVIARELEGDPRLLVVSQPTRGVDVGAMEFVHNSLIKARDGGAAVLLFSADLNEVMSLSDRLLVMYRGQIIAEFTQDTMSELAVGLAMAGVPPTEDRIAEAEAEHEKVAEVLASDIAEVTVPVLASEPLDSGSSRAGEKPSGSALASTGEESGASRHREPKRITRLLEPVKGPLIAIIIALLIGAMVISAIGANPWDTYVTLFTSPWTSSFGIASIVAFFIPLSIMAVAVIVSFRGGFFNIGGEGQLFMGAFWGAWAGFTFQGLPPVLLTILVLVVGALAGGLWGAIPGALYAFWRVNIIVTTLLMSTLATLVTLYLVTGPFKDPTSGYPATKMILADARFTMFSDEYGIGPDLIIALVVAIGLGLVLKHTTWGLKVRELGELNRFGEYTGVSARSMSIQIMTVSGAVSGLAGALFVLGPNGGRFSQMFSPGYGFLAITVALLARLNPGASLIAALFYATMMAGGTGLQGSGVPFPLVNVLQGLIIIFLTAHFTLTFLRRRRVQDAPASGAVPAAALQGSEASK